MTPAWHLDGGQTVRWMLLASLWLGAAVAIPLMWLRFALARRLLPHQHAVGRLALLAFFASNAVLVGLLNAAAAPRLFVNDPQADRAWFTSLIRHYGAGSVSPDAGSADITAYVTAGWMFGVCIMLAKLGYDYARWYRLCRSATPISIGVLLPRLERPLQRRLGQTRIRFALSDRVRQPVTGGAFRPLVVLPTDIAEWLSAPELSAVIAHEVAHIDRYDFPKNVGLQVLRAVLWFNPGFLYVMRAYEAGRELACDRAAVAYGVSSSVLARALAKISVFEPPPSKVLGAVGTGGSTVQRIKALIDSPPARPYAGILLAVVTIILCSSFGVAAARAAADDWVRLQARAEYLTRSASLDLDELTYDVCTLLQRERVFGPDGYRMSSGPVTLTFEETAMMMNGSPVPTKTRRALTRILEKHAVKREAGNYLRFYQSDAELGARSGSASFGERIGTGLWMRMIPPD